MLRQQLSVALPTSASTPTELTRGKAFGVRITPSPGQSAAAVLLTLVRRDGANETPFVYRPTQDGWLWFSTPIWGLKATALSASLTATVDVLWATEPGDRAEPPNALPELLAGPAGTDAGLAERIATKGVIVYNSGDVSGGSVINSGPISLVSLSSIYVLAINTAGASARSLYFRTYDADGVTQVDIATVASVSAGSVGRFAFGLGVSSGGVVGLLTSTNALALPVTCGFQLDPGGSAVGRIMVWGR